MRRGGLLTRLVGGQAKPKHPLRGRTDPTFAAASSPTAPRPCSKVSRTRPTSAARRSINSRRLRGRPDPTPAAMRGRLDEAGGSVAARTRLRRPRSLRGSTARKRGGSVAARTRRFLRRHLVGRHPRRCDERLHGQSGPQFLSDRRAGRPPASTRARTEGARQTREDRARVALPVVPEVVDRAARRRRIPARAPEPHRLTLRSCAPERGAGTTLRGVWARAGEVIVLPDERSRRPREEPRLPPIRQAPATRPPQRPAGACSRPGFPPSTCRVRIESLETRPSRTPRARERPAAARLTAHVANAFRSSGVPGAEPRLGDSSPGGVEPPEPDAFFRRTEIRRGRARLRPTTGSVPARRLEKCTMRIT